MKHTLLEYFEETVEKKQNCIAVIEGSEKISFLELRKKSIDFAGYLSGIIIQMQSKPVAVFLPKSIWGIIADLGILYSGNAYMNLDVKTPMNRIENILKCIQPATIITHSKYKDRFVNTHNVICVDEIEIPTCSVDFAEIHQQAIIDTDPMCLINTSGSTGTPKGVVLNHRSFIDFTEWALSTFDFSNEEVIGSLSPAVFDIYSFELCLLMTKGSQIVIIPSSFSAFPVKIMQLLNKERVTFIFWVPTIMVNIANMGLLETVPPVFLKWVWFAGEVFPTKQFNVWKNKLKHSTFVNLYGPIEITLDCTYYIVNRELSDDEPIPIGYPCKNTDILLLKEDNTLAKDGEQGEICVRGTSLAGGYYNNWEKTNAAFIQNPLNTQYPELIYKTGDLAYINNHGEMIFVGRVDSLVKHRGYRIELGEIEHVAINSLKVVDNCCVLYNKIEKQILMIYETDEALDEKYLIKAIGNELPGYMVPTQYYWMEEMPRNTNGKIDRLRLKEIYLRE